MSSEGPVSGCELNQYLNPNLGICSSCSACVTVSDDAVSTITCRNFKDKIEVQCKEYIEERVADARQALITSTIHNQATTSPDNNLNIILICSVSALALVVILVCLAARAWWHRNKPAIPPETNNNNDNNKDVVVDMDETSVDESDVGSQHSQDSFPVQEVAENEDDKRDDGNAPNPDDDDTDETSRMLLPTSDKPQDEKQKLEITDEQVQAVFRHVDGAHAADPKDMVKLRPDRAQYRPVLQRQSSSTA